MKSSKENVDKMKENQKENLEIKVMSLQDNQVYQGQRLM